MSNLSPHDGVKARNTSARQRHGAPDRMKQSASTIRRAQLSISANACSATAADSVPVGDECLHIGGRACRPVDVVKPGRVRADDAQLAAHGLQNRAVNRLVRGNQEGVVARHRRYEAVAVLAAPDRDGKAMAGGGG
jgi:hypothetical protein